MPSVSTPGRSSAPLALPNPSAVFRSRIVFTTLDDADLPTITRPTQQRDYQLVVKGHTVDVPLLYSRYHHPDTTAVPLALFSIDDVLTYSKFAFDHGPLNICQVHHFATLLHAIFNDPSNSGKAICLYSSPDERLKSSAACLLALYFILIEEEEPWEVYTSLSEMSFIPFRDASQGEADHGISIQDVLWGAWKARRYGLLTLDDDFDAAEYEWFEQPTKGDLNTIGPFIPFASPVDPDYFASRNPTSTPSRNRSSAKGALRDVLAYFEEVGVKMVVRLNEKLYDASVFEEKGIRHVEMHFPDGSNPPENYVREFIKLADRTISDGGKVAVHCKAGLGRTGVLIGAYLIYKYGFAPNEVIAYMRLIRPGMVVGPQQAFMNTMFATWIRWSAVDEMNCLRRTTAVLSESTVVNHTSKGNASSPGGNANANDTRNVQKENSTSRTVFALKEEVIPMDTVDPRMLSIGLSTPSRTKDRCDSQMSGMRTPGQPRKTPSGGTVVPADQDVDDDTQGIALLTERNQPFSASPGLASPNKPRIRLEAVFDPPTANITPQRLFSPHRPTDTVASHLTRKAPPETASPDRSVKRRAVGTPGRITRTRSAAPTMEAGSPGKADDILSPSSAQSAAPTPSRIPTMMSSIKRMESKLGRSKSHAGIQQDHPKTVATPRTAAKMPAEDDVFGSPSV